MVILKQFQFHTHVTNRGFSLLELILVVGIFVIISTVTLISYSKFNSQTLLNSLAYDMALTMREAQTYAFSVRGTSIQGAGFTTGYGLYFSQTAGNSYVFFADTDQNGVYDFDSMDLNNPLCNRECIELFDVQRYAIADVCATRADDSTFCFSSNALHDVHITFTRPNPDASFTADCVNDYREITVTVRAGDGTERHIMVVSTGQISVLKELPASYNYETTCI